MVIVLRHHFELCENVLFLMREDDDRYNTPNYIPVTGGRLTKQRVLQDNGCRARVFLGDNGKRYFVFSDWAVRQAN